MREESVGIAILTKNFILTALSLFQHQYTVKVFMSHLILFCPYPRGEWEKSEEIQRKKWGRGTTIGEKMAVSVNVEGVKKINKCRKQMQCVQL